MDGRKKIVTSGVMLILILAGMGSAYYWYFYMRADYKTKIFREKYRIADELHDKGDYQKSLDAFEKALEAAPNKSAETQTKFVIAFELYTRNQGNDRNIAVEIYKKIAVDESVSKFQRAIAINDLIDHYQGSQSEDFARTAIFAGKPFEEFYVDGDVALSIRRLYEFSDSLYPLAFTEYRIGRWYGTQLEDTALAAEEERKNYLAQLNKWTQKGDINLPATLKLGYEKSKIAAIYQIQALNYATLARYGNRDYKQSIAAFRNALETVRPGENNHIFDYIVSQFVRFHFASMLGRVYGEERINEIKELLKLAADPMPLQFKGYPNNFYVFLKNEAGNEHDAHGHKKDILWLSSHVPEFRAMVEREKIVY